MRKNVLVENRHVLVEKRPVLGQTRPVLGQKRPGQCPHLTEKGEEAEEVKEEPAVVFYPYTTKHGDVLSTNCETSSPFSSEKEKGSNHTVGKRKGTKIQEFNTWDTN